MNRQLRCCAIVGLAIAGVAQAQAGPIAAPPPGAPLDGHDHIINVREVADGNETAASISYTLMGGGTAVDAKQNPDGSFALNISLVPGLVRCCAGDEPSSDAFFIVATATGIDLNFSSDFDPTLPQPSGSDSITVMNVGANRKTEFRIFSPAEPAPEPTSLLLLATGVAGLGAAASFRRMRRLRGPQPPGQTSQ